MHELKELETALKFIENKENYYAGFRHVIEACARADVINTALWNASKIEDHEKLMYSDRIRTAKSNAIKRHQAWMIRRMQESTGHTVESLNLTENMRIALECRIKGLSYPEIGRVLQRAHSTVFEYFLKMRQRYMAIYG